MIKKVAYTVLAILLLVGVVKTVDWWRSCGRDTLCQARRNLATDFENQRQVRQPVHTAVSKIETICNRDIVLITFSKTVQKVVVNPTGLCAVVPKVHRGEIIFTGPDGPQEPMKPEDGLGEEKRVRVSTIWALTEDASADVQLCPPTKAKMTTWC